MRISAVKAGIQSGFDCDIRKCAVAIVVIKRAVVQPSNEQIGMPIVVVIGSGNAHVVARACKPGGTGDIGENAVAIIAEQTIAVFRIGLLERGIVSGALRA